MSVHFCIYSTDAADHRDPTTASDYTYFYANPKYGVYDDYYQQTGRGSHIEVLEGMVHQDFGMDEEDRKIYIRDGDTYPAIPRTIKKALQAKYEEKDAEWYFTPDNGLTVYLVVFSRNPAGFKTQKNMLLYNEGLQADQPKSDKYNWYSYEILLHVKEVVGDSSGES
jgi:hypothetical protein